MKTIKGVFAERSVIFNTLIRWWLTAILVILPFHYVTSELIEWRINYEFSVWFKRLDEITIVIFFFLAVIMLYRNRQNINWLYYILMCPIILIGISGIISGLINENSLFVTCYGIFDYIKNFLVIFIYAAFIKDYNDVKKIFRILLGFVVFIGFIAFIQEFWALFSRYILGYDKLDESIFILRDNSEMHINAWRMGIYRAPSFMGHPIDLGLYCLLILTVYMCMVKKVKIMPIIFMMTGIIVSASRVVYAGFIFMAGVQFFRGRKWILILMLIPVIVFVFSKSNFSEFDMNDRQLKKGYITYRVYARQKAIEVWKEHPLWGAGPGMFGGPVSIKTRSPLYEKNKRARISESNKMLWRLIKPFGSLDQFWPQLLAEMGIIGTVAFSGLFISLVVVLFVLRQRTTPEDMRGLLTGLTVFTGIIFIYNFGYRLNVSPVLFTYCAFTGMFLGCEQNRSAR